MSKQSKRNVWLSCRIKKAHHNYWTALQHCVSLQKESPFDPIHVYKCLYCDGMHVTRGKTNCHNRTIRKSLKRTLRSMSNINFWLCAPPEIIEKTIKIEMRLLKHVLGIQPVYAHELSVADGLIEPEFVEEDSYEQCGEEECSY